ncbi:hypothetical protein KFE25_001325 [Diacronema lutheri]|uniref:Uncharacterized protein n=1 Tax=Diacronema lutheri TaxID=2081491 RepID=A0A8J6C4G9_DIALT|nr:hypothetical protein KFE25_001325 [Diacronema lutheri]
MADAREPRDAEGADAALPPSEGRGGREMSDYERTIKALWEEHDEIVELLMVARLGGKADEEAELRRQLSEVRAAVELNARLLGAEEVKVWMMGADPRRTPREVGAGAA